MYYSAYESAPRKKDSVFLMLLWVVMLFVAVFYVYPQSLQYSQLASPDDGQVRYRWMEKNGQMKCLVLNKDSAPKDCSVYSSGELKKIALIWSKPEPVKLKFGGPHQ